MSQKQAGKPYWEMTTAGLAEATNEFDKEFMADQAQPLMESMQARWERAKLKGLLAAEGEDETKQLR